MPLVGGGGHWCVPELIKVAGAGEPGRHDRRAGQLARQGGRRTSTKRFIERTKEPWFGHDSIFAYAHVMIFKEAMERAGVRRPPQGGGRRCASIDITDGPALFFPDGRLKYDEKGRRVGAKLCIVQWQNGRPVAVHPELDRQSRRRPGRRLMP